MMALPTKSSIKESFLQYEISNAPWWVGLIGWTWGQDIAANYYTRKVNRKVDNYFKYLRTRRTP
jgi:hypothetical protein